LISCQVERRVRQAQRNASLLLYLRAWRNALEPSTDVLRQRCRLGYIVVNEFDQAGCDRPDCGAVEFRALGALAETDQGNANGRALVDPRLVTPRLENSG